MWEDAVYIMLSKEDRVQNYIQNLLTMLLFITSTQRKYKNSRMIVTLKFFIIHCVFFKILKTDVSHFYYNKYK